jgi:4'-phosphopantetheinyl transferase
MVSKFGLSEPKPTTKDIGSVSGTTDLANRLEEGLVVFFPLQADDDEYRGLVASLAADELIRANRFVTERLTRRFVICRGRLRKSLGAILNIAPDEITFDYGLHGKPSLASQQVGSGLSFNVSHSGDWAAIALSRAEMLGIDIESKPASINADALMNQILSEREQRFFESRDSEKLSLDLAQAWVAKEAVGKALGIGWSRGLKSLELPIEFYENFDGNHEMMEFSIASDIFATKASESSTQPEPKKLFLRRLGGMSGLAASLCCDRNPRHFASICWEDFSAKLREE